MGSYSCILLFLHLLIAQSLGIIFPQDGTESSSAYSEKFFDSSSSSSTGSLENYYSPLMNYGSPLQKDATQELQDDQPRDKGWNYLDTSKTWTPHEKTISFQYLDDDGKFSHAPPAWPHDEYLTQFPQGGSGYYNPFKKNESEPLTENYPSDPEYDKDYEWKRLRPRPPKSLFIGPGFYDDGSQPSLQQQQHYSPGQTHQSITESSASASASAGDGQVPNAVSESNTNGKFYGGGGGNPYYDDYRRRRFRLKIHPGLLVAPIAGFAAYKAVSAIASKPLMLELGWVNNRPNVEFGGGGWGWNQNPYPQNPYPQIPYPQNPYPNQNPYPIYPPPQYYPPIVSPLPNPYPAGVPLPVDYPYPRPSNPTKYPILRPPRKPQDQKSSWWNPFSALTPRFRSKKERAKTDPDCCDE